MSKENGRGDPERNDKNYELKPGDLSGKFINQNYLNFNKDKVALPAPKQTKVKFKGLKRIFEDMDESLVGMEPAKLLLRRMAAAEVARQGKIHGGHADGEKPSNHTILRGNPGTGKTSIARYVGKIMYFAGFLDKPDVVEVTRKDLVAGYIGQTAIKTAAAIEKAKGGVLFIDEAGSLAGGFGNDFGREAIMTLLPALENNRGDFICVMAGYGDDIDMVMKIDQGMRSRFPHHCDMPDYTLEQMQLILSNQIIDKKLVIEPDAWQELLKILEDCYYGSDPKTSGNGRLIRNMVEVLDSASKLPDGKIEDLEFEALFMHAASTPTAGSLTLDMIKCLKPDLLKTAHLKPDGFTGTMGFIPPQRRLDRN